MTSTLSYWDVTKSSAITIDNSSSMAVGVSGTGSHVLQRHTYSELYAIYRPSIDIVERYVTPVWYAVGIPGNALAFLVWIRQRMRASSGCFLAALAFNDLIFLILHLIFELQATWDIPVVERPGVCETFPIIFLTTQYVNPLLVLGFSVERYIAVCHPFRRHTYCTTSRAVRVIAGLIIASLALHSVQGYFWHYDTTDGVCKLRETVTASGTNSVWSIWSWITELLVFAVVPVVILLLNAVVFSETRRLLSVSDGATTVANSLPLNIVFDPENAAAAAAAAATDRTPTVSSSTRNLLFRYSTASSASSACLRRHRQRGFGTAATTAMLLAVSFYLIAATLPVTLCYVLHLNFPEGDLTMSDDTIWNDPAWQAHFDYWNIRTVIQELSMSHYACNFYIYVVTGAVFRAELRELFTRCPPVWIAALLRGRRTSDRRAAVARFTPSAGLNAIVVSGYSVPRGRPAGYCVVEQQTVATATHGTESRLVPLHQRLPQTRSCSNSRVSVGDNQPVNRK